MTAQSAGQAAGGSRWQRIKGSMTPAQWRRAAVLAVVVIGLHVIGFGLLFGEHALRLRAGSHSRERHHR